jgi:Secretion system C-terminal sorting domain
MEHQQGRKLLLLFITIVLAFNTARGQNYYLNVPVYDTISSSGFSITPSVPLCPSAEIAIDTAFIHKITGVNYYLKILSGTIPANSLIEINSMDTLNFGDSILISNSNIIAGRTTLDFGSYYNSGNFFYSLIAIGTPTQLDSFYCKSEIYFGGGVTADFCSLLMFRIYHVGPIEHCEVSLPTDILSESENKELLLFPNPCENNINVTAKENEPTEIILYDLSSRKLLQQTFTNSTTINTEQLAKGMYLYTVRNRNGIIKNGKVIKE